MERRLVVGIDGGGTKTVALAADNNGNILSQVTGKTINYNAVGMNKARENMKNIFDELCAECKVDCFDSVFIGMSALYTQASEEEVEAFAGGVIPSKVVKMNSDLYVALQSSGIEGECVLTISGTGSMVISRDSDGLIHELGGWGYLLGDEGSAYSLALRGLKSAVNYADGVAEETSLLPAFMKHFGISNPRDIIDCIYDPVLSRDQIASLAPIVGKCAENEDKVAKNIIIEEAEFLAGVACKAIENLNSSCAPVVTYGGVFVNNRIFRTAFDNFIVKKYPDSEVNILKTPPQVGAVYCAVENIDSKLKETLKNNYFKMIEG